MFCKKLLQSGMENFFLVKKGDTLICKVPLLFPVLFAIPFCWILMVLLIAGLFTGCQYSCTGPCFQTNSNQAPNMSGSSSQTQSGSDCQYADLLQKHQKENGLA